MKLLFALAFSCLFTLGSFASDLYIAPPDTTDPGMFKQGTVPAKMIAARHEFLDNNIRGALAIYRDVLQIEPDNASANYRTAECHYKLKRYDLAFEYLDKALEIDPNVSKEKDFFRGQIYHRLAELDKAIASFETFLASDPAKRSLEYELCTEYLAQCKYAKLLMAEPAPVTITNLGREINTRFDDYTPSVVADGSKLFFTSRRSDTQGGEIDEGGDYKYYEDVYFSTWNAEDEEWDIAAGIPGAVNTPDYDAVLSVAPDGNELFIYKNNANSAGDIFSCSYDKSAASWRMPEKLDKPINTSYFEASVSITRDGNTLYFISERPGGKGQGDIWVSQKKGSEWGKPEPLSDVINTEFDEKFVFIHPNGRTLYFASNGHQTMGSYDIFKSELTNGKWSLPVNLGYPINTVNEESTFSLTADNTTMFIAAEYADSYGERDIYKVDVSEYPLISQGYDKSNTGTVICNVRDSGGSPLRKAVVKVFDAATNAPVSETEVDKAGQAKLSLMANKSYRIQVIWKLDMKEELVEVKLNGSEAPVIKLNFSF